MRRWTDIARADDGQTLYCPTYQFQTDAGLLQLHAVIGKTYSFFGSFADPPAGARYTSCNEHSGKWHHYAKTAKEAAEALCDIVFALHGMRARRYTAQELVRSVQREVAFALSPQRVPPRGDPARKAAARIGWALHRYRHPFFYTEPVSDDDPDSTSPAETGVGDVRQAP